MLRSVTTVSLLGAALIGALPATTAQGQSLPTPIEQARNLDPQEFLRLAYSSATLQEQASKLAASRETRPEVKSFAAEMAGYRANLLQRLQAFAQEHNLSLPPAKEFEHQIILENLAPLEYLALSRRYIETELQALGQEIRVYQAAGGSAHEGVKAFAAQVLPALQQHYANVQKVYKAVGP